MKWAPGMNLFGASRLFVGDTWDNLFERIKRRQSCGRASECSSTSSKWSSTTSKWSSTTFKWSSTTITVRTICLNLLNDVNPVEEHLCVVEERLDEVEDKWKILLLGILWTICLNVLNNVNPVEEHLDGPPLHLNGPPLHLIALSLHLKSKCSSTSSTLRKLYLHFL